MQAAGIKDEMKYDGISIWIMLFGVVKWFSTGLDNGNCCCSWAYICVERNRY